MSQPATWPFRPLSDTELREIAELGPRYAGWAIEEDDDGRRVAVDVLGLDEKPQRFRGETLRKALQAAREARA